MNTSLPGEGLQKERKERNPARKESSYAVLCANKTRLRRAGAADKIENRRFGRAEMAGRREKLLPSGDKGGRWEKSRGRVAMEQYAVIAPLPHAGRRRYGIRRAADRV